MYAYCRKMVNKNEIAEQQQKTVMEIAELMRVGKQVIYIDESQFHKQLVCERVWIKRDMMLCKPDSRGRGATVIGAITEKQGLFHYKILREITDTFASLVLELIHKIKGVACIYMDIHYGRITRLNRCGVTI